MIALAPALTAFAATIAISGTPTPPAQYPVAVTRCNVADTAIIGFPEGGTSVIQPGGLQISFVNHAPIAAKDVTFVVHYAGTTQTIDDRGTFSQDIAIDHSFNPNALPFGSGTAECSVASVQFADGTTWQQS